jgi:hypothetical protein
MGAKTAAEVANVAGKVFFEIFFSIENRPIGDRRDKCLAASRGYTNRARRIIRQNRKIPWRAGSEKVDRL